MVFGTGMGSAAMLRSVRSPYMGTRRLLVYGGGEATSMGTAIPPHPAHHCCSTFQCITCPSRVSPFCIRKTLSSLKLLSPASFPSSFTHTQLSRLKSNRKTKIHLQPPIAWSSPFSFRANFWKALSPLTVCSSSLPPHSLFNHYGCFPPLFLN